MTIQTLDINGQDYTAYSSVDEADTYLAIDPIRNTAWDGLTAVGKQQRLAMATRRLDLLQWIGVKAATDQQAAWPRLASRSPEALLEANGVQAPKDNVPKAIEQATALLAGTAASNPAATTIRRPDPRIEQVKAGPTMTKFWHPRIVSVDPNDIRQVDAEVYEIIKPWLVLSTRVLGTGAAGDGDAPANFRGEEFNSIYPYGSSVYNSSSD